MAHKFVCAECGGEFVSHVSEQAARAEAEEIFQQPIDDMVEVCDDCWNKLKYQWEQ